MKNLRPPIINYPLTPEGFQWRQVTAGEVICEGDEYHYDYICTATYDGSILTGWKPVTSWSVGGILRKDWNLCRRLVGTIPGDY